MSEKPSNDTHEKSSSSSLVIPRKQLTYITASLLMVGFVLFMGGYFLGKKVTIDQLLESVEQESLSDNIYASLCSLYSRDEDDDEDEGVEIPVLTEPSPAPDDSSASEESSSDEAADNQAEYGGLPSDVAELSQDDSPDFGEKIVALEENEDSPRYVALLIGFGTYKAAAHCASRLMRKGFPVHVENRSSTTARGKRITWYQVVTQSYERRDDLEELVDRISEEEKIKDARIIVVS